MHTFNADRVERKAAVLFACAALATLSACTADSASQDAATAGSTDTRLQPSLPASPELRNDSVTARVASMPTARALLRPTEGNTTSGVVEFTERPDGTLDISVELAELAEGEHGLHVHETGDCSAPDASSAGEHFSPDGHAHGSPTDEIHHAGDLGNASADARGIAVARLEASDLTLAGHYGIVNRAVIVHAGKDDFVSQPSGDSGDPTACGVIRLTAAPDSTG